MPRPQTAELYESCGVTCSGDVVTDLRRLCEVYAVADPAHDSGTANIASLALDVLAPRLLNEVEKARPLLHRVRSQLQLDLLSVKVGREIEGMIREIDDLLG